MGLNICDLDILFFSIHSYCHSFYNHLIWKKGVGIKIVHHQKTCVALEYTVNLLFRTFEDLAMDSCIIINWALGYGPKFSYTYE